MKKLLFTIILSIGVICQGQNIFELDEVSQHILSSAEQNWKLEKRIKKYELQIDSLKQLLDNSISIQDLMDYQIMCYNDSTLYGTEWRYWDDKKPVGKEIYLHNHYPTFADLLNYIKKKYKK